MRKFVTLLVVFAMCLCYVSDVAAAGKTSPIEQRLGKFGSDQGRNLEIFTRVDGWKEAFINVKKDVSLYTQTGMFQGVNKALVLLTAMAIDVNKKGIQGVNVYTYKNIFAHSAAILLKMSNIMAMEKEGSKLYEEALEIGSKAFNLCAFLLVPLFGRDVDMDDVSTIVFGLKSNEVVGPYVNSVVVDDNNIWGRY